MGEVERVEEAVFRHLVRAGLDHDDGLLARGHHEVEPAGVALGLPRIDDELVADQADPHGADRALEGHVRDRQRRRSAVDGQDRRVVLHVGGEHRGDHLDVVAHALGEQRADGAVHQAGRVDGVLAGPALPLEEASRDLAGGVHLLLEVAGQREEVDAFPGLLGDGRRDEHQRVAVPHGDRAAGLPGQPAGFEDERASGNVQLDAVGGGFDHCCLLS